MSSWLKSEGAKIIVKFTSILVGECTGHESKLAIAGSEPLYVKYPSEELGPLVEGDYVVDETQIRPPTNYHEEDFATGVHTDTEVVLGNVVLESLAGATDEKDERDPTGGGTSRSSTVALSRFKADDLNISAIYVRPSSATTYNLLVKKNGTTIETVQGTSAAINSWIKFVLTDPLAVDTDDDVEITLTKNGGGNYTPNYRTGAYDGTLWKTQGGTWGTAHTLLVGYEFAGEGGYVAEGNYLSDSIALSGMEEDIYIYWDAEIPTDTSLSIEAAVSGETLGVPDEPVEEDWSEQTNGSLIDVLPEVFTGKHLWLRISLATTDSDFTSSVSRLYLGGIKDYTLLQLSMEALKRFNNVEGDITVNYTVALGGIEGVYGAVDSFQNDFTPTNLIRVPNPYLSEELAVALVGYSVDLVKIYRIVVGQVWDDENGELVYGPYGNESDPVYSSVLRQKEQGSWGAYGSDKISVSLVDYAITLTHIDNIDP